MYSVADLTISKLYYLLYTFFDTQVYQTIYIPVLYRLVQKFQVFHLIFVLFKLGTLWDLLYIFTYLTNFYWILWIASDQHFSYLNKRKQLSRYKSLKCLQLVLQSSKQQITVFTFEQ